LSPITLLKITEASEAYAGLLRYLLLEGFGLCL